MTIPSKHCIGCVLDAGPMLRSLADFVVTFSIFDEFIDHVVEGPGLHWQVFIDLEFDLVEQLQPGLFGFGFVAGLQTFPQILAIADSDVGLPKAIAPEQQQLSAF